MLPRLLFGEYLSTQFDRLLTLAKDRGIDVNVHLQTKIIDIVDRPVAREVAVVLENGGEHVFNQVVICTGHVWPRKHEGKVPGYYESPYPPRKLSGTFNHPVAVRGASLTAIDAIRTISRSHGSFHLTET